MKKKWLIGVLIVAMILTAFTGCASKSDEPTTEEATVATTVASSEETTSQAPTAQKPIILSTTTSTENSGLLEAILPDFTAKTGIEVKVIAVGSGKAIQLGVDGEADVLLVHAKASEEQFVADGYGVERFDVMYNDFVLVGPKADEAGIKAAAGKDILKSFEMINQDKIKFVSRGDDSGTHKKELEYWKAINVEPSGDNYISAGKGMGDVLLMASEMQAYTLTDRATYLSMKSNLDLEIIVEGDALMFNQYGVIAVNPDKNSLVNNAGANAFIEWILSKETQELISKFGVDEFGQSLFYPNAK
ncbi:ABC transporter substrate-binding protein [Fusibacter bizertensis]